MTFKVQKRMCSTCIYRPDSNLDLEKLENDVRDPHMGFKGHRICHHSDNVCCRGFWEAHKDEFPLGQISQRLGMVEFVEVDNMSDEQNKAPADSWIKVDHDDEHQLDTLKAGLYWVVIQGDWEPDEFGGTIYDYPDYRTIFNITNFDEETGVPIGCGYFTDEEWETVVYIWPAQLFEPEMPNE